MYVNYSAILNRKKMLQIWTNASLSKIDETKRQIINRELLKLGVKEKRTISISSETIINQIPSQLEENGFKVSYEQPDCAVNLTTQEVYPKEIIFKSSKI